MLDFDISFIPETVEEKLESAKLDIIELLELDEYKWLRARINDEHLCWKQIFEIVANLQK